MKVEDYAQNKHSGQRVSVLRSSSLNLLHVPLTTKAVGCKAFRFSAPTVCNSIPQNIRLSSSIGSFKHNLKTYLFSVPG